MGDLGAPNGTGEQVAFPEVSKDQKATEDFALDLQKRVAATPLAKPPSIREYLEKTVVTVLQQGMQQLVRERPEDPCEFLANYLIKHNPKHKAAGKAEPMAS